jgi:hypothetical protein
MVRHGEIKSEQSDDGADQSLGRRSARPKTMPIVSAVVIAGTEKWGWPPGVVRASARHAWTANHTVSCPAASMPRHTPPSS